MVVGHCCLRQCGHHRFIGRFDTEHPIMPKLRSMPDAIAELVPDGASVALGLQMEQMIPFAAGHEIIRQRKRGLTLIGPISDILFDQMIGAGCVEQVIAAWVGNVMMGSAYNFRRAVEQAVIASDPSRTVIPGFLVNAVVECRYGAHPSPVQGYYKRDDAFFRQYHEQTKTKADSDDWLDRWVYGLEDRAAYMNQLGGCRVEDLAVKQHAYAVATDFGY